MSQPVSSDEAEAIANRQAGPLTHAATAGLLRSTRARSVLIVAFGSLALAGVLAFSGAAENPGDALTRNTVRLSLAWYAAALALMLFSAPADWRTATPRGQWARWCWTWALVCFWVHVGLAFHYFDHWSHARALERTRHVSGTAEGLYVSYLFIWLWTADAAWWWIDPRRYAARPAAVGRALHAFMLLIVFNGMVVFESGVIRWAGLFMFAALAMLWFASRRCAPASSA